MHRLASTLALLSLPFVSGCAVLDLLHWAEAPVDLVLLPADVLVQHGYVSEAREPGPMEAALHARAAETGHRRLIVNTSDEAHDPKLWARSCDAGDLDACGRAASVFVYFFHDREHGLEVWERLCDEGRGEYCLRAGDVYVTKLAPGDPRRSPQGLYLAGCAAASPSALACRRAARGVQAQQRAWRGERSDRWPRHSLELEDRACALGEWHACYALFVCLDGGSCGFGPDRVLSDYYQRCAGERALGRPCAPAFALEEAVRLERLEALGDTAE